MKSFLASALILFIAAVSAAAQVTVDCVVKNANGEPLGYATAYCPQNETGIAANADGRLSIEVESTSDSLRFSMLGYTSRTLLVSEVLGNPAVILEPQSFAIQDVVVTSENTFRPLLGAKNTLASLSGSPGRILLVKVNNPAFSGKYISKVIAEKRPVIPKPDKKKKKAAKPSFPTCLLRCRVFAIGQDGLPSHDILVDNIIAENIQESETIEVDISAYNIEVAPGGVFVGFEWLPVEQNYTYRSFFDPTIYMTSDVKEPLTVFGSMKGDWEWFILTKEDDIPFFISKKTRNAKIGIEVKE